MIIGAKLFWQGPLTTADVAGLAALFPLREVRIVTVAQTSASGMEIEIAVVSNDA